MKKSCNKPCGPSDYTPGGKCDLNGCYDTPITEEALRESYEIFNEYRGSVYLFLEIEIRYGVYVRINFKQGMLYNVSVWLDDEGRSSLIFPNCRTMQDLETLIRLLGGAQ